MKRRQFEIKVDQERADTHRFLFLDRLQDTIAKYASIERGFILLLLFPEIVRHLIEFEYQIRADTLEIAQNCADDFYFSRGDIHGKRLPFLPRKRR